ncbi:porin [Rhizobium sp. RU36D]|uniref:porin n=1 Tax=Rhizobium sp. RU36D TaxID=1907415 RepID=UPI0009D868BB|nr:porin [Rhizobium sp. RU36D]SMD11395.1 Porin subfamily protein [Rhizobium sp. RU36D]
MNIKSLLIGSAAALAAVSGAQAADAIVAAEPEPMEYVRVCDAFGTGYFYIPGTETCLKIGGYVRFQVDWSSVERAGDDFDWNARTRGLVSFDAKSDTELGTLGSKIVVRTWAESDSAASSLEIDEAYLTLGGFKAGYAYNYWDAGLSGETDELGSNRLNTIGYEYSANAFKFGAYLDELTKTQSGGLTAPYAGNDNLGIEAQLSGSFGPITAALLGGYDIAEEDGAVRAILTADIGPGKLGVAGIYSSGRNAYYDQAEWTIAAEYAAKITDKLSITPGFQYWDTISLNSRGDFVGDLNAWKAGVTLDYLLVTGLNAKVSVQYKDVDRSPETWSGYFRLQRSF